MQTTGFHTRLLKRIDTYAAVSGPEEKKIRIYRRIMFHRTTLFRLKSARWCCHFYTRVRFCKHIAHFGPTLTQHHGSPALYPTIVLRWILTILVFGIHSFCFGVYLLFFLSSVYRLSSIVFCLSLLKLIFCFFSWGLSLL